MHVKIHTGRQTDRRREDGMKRDGEKEMERKTERHRERKTEG